jgi:hypothetical protein
MKFFKKKNLENLESKIEKETHTLKIPINEYDRLKCKYYNEFQKKEIILYKSDPINFWRKATEYADKKLREYKYNKKN